MINVAVGTDIFSVGNNVEDGMIVVDNACSSLGVFSEIHPTKINENAKINERNFFFTILSPNSDW